MYHLVNEAFKSVFIKYGGRVTDLYPSASMEEGRNPSVFFLIDPLESIFLTRSFDPLAGDVHSQNVALKKHRTKNHTSLIEKSINL